MSVDDKYTYPGSGGVLVNAAGIRDQRQLDEAMNDVASITMAEVRAERVPDRPGYDYLQSVHERMFGDLVPGIAGRIRDVDVQATGTGIPYCRPEYIDANLATAFGKLEREDYLTGLDADTFADRLADRGESCRPSTPTVTATPDPRAPTCPRSPSAPGTRSTGSASTSTSSAPHACTPSPATTVPSRTTSVPTWSRVCPCVMRMSSTPSSAAIAT
jgi:hypothetical protein